MLRTRGRLLAYYLVGYIAFMLVFVFLNPAGDRPIPVIVVALLLALFTAWSARRELRKLSAPSS